MLRIFAVFLTTFYMSLLVNSDIAFWFEEKKTFEYGRCKITDSNIANFYFLLHKNILFYVYPLTSFNFWNQFGYVLNWFGYYNSANITKIGPKYFNFLS